MAIEKAQPVGGALEQFAILAKTAKGAACAELVKQVLEASGIYVFGELLEMPNVEELANSTQFKLYHNTLNLFAYGTVNDFEEKPSDFIELSDVQKKKLQHLTIVTLATKSKCIPYGVLLSELRLSNVRHLEDLIIEAIYADIIHGKLDQKNKQLEVDYAIGRDIRRPDDIGVIANCLQDWCVACENVLASVESQIIRANNEKNMALSRAVAVDVEISNIKKTLKAQLQDRSDADEMKLVENNREAMPSNDKGKKPVKSGGFKQSGINPTKFWSNKS